jgi:hypothetical protein
MASFFLPWNTKKTAPPGVIGLSFLRAASFIEPLFFLLIKEALESLLPKALAGG